MASSDEEGEILPQYVSNYHFVDDSGAPVSFSVLPVRWDVNDVSTNLEGTHVALRGTCSNGIQKIYLPVMGWKFELSYVQPEISVFCKAKKWVMLQKPRKVFEQVVRKILITVHWLHFIKKNPNASEKSVWKHLLKTFSTYEDPPSENDLLDHKGLIMEAARRDKDLKAFRSFCTFIGKSEGGETFYEGVQTIIDDDGSEKDFFDTACAICDNGGDILCCNGRCLRSFHPTVADGEESQCASLGYRNKAEYEAIQIFMCENCIYQQHQCFACGRLGFSDRSSSQEVFPCASATCGHFYHPQCVARLLHTGNETQAEELRAKISTGESFVCPAHKCFICKECEDADVDALQFAICRRCPKAYHRKCLPRGIVHAHENNLARAWEGLLPNRRILIYCMEHKIDRQLKTPARDHIIFPKVERRHTLQLMPRQRKLVISKRTEVSDGFAVDRTAVKKPKLIKKLHDCVEIGNSSETEKRYPAHDFEPLKKSNIIHPDKQALKKNICSVSARSSTVDTRNLLSGNNSLVNSGFYPSKFKQQNIVSSKMKNSIPDKPAMKKISSSLPSVGAETKKRILMLMEDVSSSFDAEEFKKRNVPNTLLYCSRNALEKSFTLGLVEASVKAVRTALQNLEKGCSIEDAKTVCQPEILKQIFRWQKKLGIYLTPFLHGARYTSFGRHFTQVGKLKEIVDRLQWYVQDGDMIVDFCCGSNEFSCLLKEKLEQTGKSCLFRNYDIIQAKNDFCFEKKDWLKVGLGELPDGARLIMGLNPPFGVKASLSNIFIKKALEFKPKLIVLITPKETERLDKNGAYDLIWEDDALLSGKAFYLPGSVDVNDNQMESWNLSPPPLYLWSRTDWTVRHMSVAQQCGHI
ncbi:hypothetical protein P3X46_018127 [Hevea brasiliensis]|uniref:Zinc finger PHD-type domain-containing protein n=1 Tax=Hevea brasiliensis TaxID=3981 RepID=A0ABQ9LSY6_HEVBR|nr:protein ENHANCED DOWNY MILDEW 2 isoform X1 [Hevea brasiliensis]KAJ9169990.1 hypothetical protein P3X46_018127 [Hevea brasiliensis]